VEKLFEVTEHHARLYRSRTTGKVIAVPLPQEVKLAGLVGPRLTALLAFQKRACHMSYTSIQTFLDDVFRLPLSTGQIAKISATPTIGLAHPCRTSRKGLNIVLNSLVASNSLPKGRFA
jgi:hypothetical protein